MARHCDAHDLARLGDAEAAARRKRERRVRHAEPRRLDAPLQPRRVVEEARAERLETRALVRHEQRRPLIAAGAAAEQRAAAAATTAAAAALLRERDSDEADDLEHRRELVRVERVVAALARELGEERRVVVDGRRERRAERLEDDNDAMVVRLATPAELV